MRRKRASDFPQELLDLFEVMCMAGSAAVNSWTEPKNLRSEEYLPQRFSRC